MEITEWRGPVTDEQAARLQPIFAEAFGEPPSASFLDRLNEKKDLCILLAHKGDRLIGFKIGYTRFKGVFFSWLGAVSSAHRRKGVARKLLRHQQALCIEEGYNEMQTEASGSNQAMLILNLQEGFDISGVHLGRRNELTVQLRKRLDPSKPEKNGISPRSI